MRRTIQAKVSASLKPKTKNMSEIFQDDNCDFVEDKLCGYNYRSRKLVRDLVVNFKQEVLTLEIKVEIEISNQSLHKGF